MDIRERELLEAMMTHDRAALREALRLVLDRLREVPSEEAGEGAVASGGYFSRAEVEHLRRVLGEVPPCRPN